MKPVYKGLPDDQKPCSEQEQRESLSHAEGSLSKDTFEALDQMSATLKNIHRRMLCGGYEIVNRAGQKSYLSNSYE